MVWCGSIQVALLWSNSSAVPVHNRLLSAASTVCWILRAISLPIHPRVQLSLTWNNTAVSIVITQSTTSPTPLPPPGIQLRTSIGRFSCSGSRRGHRAGSGSSTPSPLIAMTIWSVHVSITSILIQRVTSPCLQVPMFMFAHPSSIGSTKSFRKWRLAKLLISGACAACHRLVGRLLRVWRLPQGRDTLSPGEGCAKDRCNELPAHTRALGWRVPTHCPLMHTEWILRQWHIHPYAASSRARANGVSSWTKSRHRSVLLCFSTAPFHMCTSTNTKHSAFLTRILCPSTELPLRALRVAGGIARLPPLHRPPSGIATMPTTVNDGW